MGCFQPARIIWMKKLKWLQIKVGGWAANGTTALQQWGGGPRVITWKGAIVSPNTEVLNHLQDGQCKKKKTRQYQRLAATWDSNGWAAVNKHAAHPFKAKKVPYFRKSTYILRIFNNWTSPDYVKNFFYQIRNICEKKSSEEFCFSN